MLRSDVGLDPLVVPGSAVGSSGAVDGTLNSVAPILCTVRCRNNIQAWYILEYFCHGRWLPSLGLLALDGNGLSSVKFWIMIVLLGMSCLSFSLSMTSSNMREVIPAEEKL